MGMPWQQAIRGAGGVLLQREVPESVNLRVAEVARAAGVPARPRSRTCAVACGFTYVPLDRNWQRSQGAGGLRERVLLGLHELACCACVRSL